MAFFQTEPKPGAVLLEQCNSLKEYLDLMEKMLIQRCLAGIPRDLDLLEQLVIEHKQFENDLSSRELEVSAPLFKDCLSSYKFFVKIQQMS